MKKYVLSSVVGGGFFAASYLLLSLGFAPSLGAAVVAFGASSLIFKDSYNLDKLGKENLEDYKIYNYPLLKLAKAHCDNQIEGFIKIIAEKEGEIKGAHIVSLEASSLISQIQIAIKGKLRVNDIKEIIFAHPTLSEGIKEALFE